MRTEMNKSCKAPGAVHFIGVGGVGMAGLAHLVADLGGRVTGSDAVETPMLRDLKARGLDMRVGHGRAVPGTPEAVVFSSAIREDNPELRNARARGIRCVRRGEYLGELARHFDRVVAVAGSHGKTSTSAMLAHICLNAGLKAGYLVGGQVPGWMRSASAGDGRLLITEVDESDGTQVFTRPTLGLVLNVEDDHCWGFGGVEGLERCFRTFAEHCGTVMTWKSEATLRLFGDLKQTRLVDEKQIPENLKLAIPGAHNRIDATMALLAAETLGVTREQALKALETFRGVDRRLSVRARSGDGQVILLDDYAHHPTELRALLQAVAEGYPGYARAVVFQPHRFERVRRYGGEFSRILGETDHCWVVAPFAAWVGDGNGVDAASIARNIRDGKGEYLPLDQDIIVSKVGDWLRRHPGKNVVVTVGAGDIEGCVGRLAGDILRNFGNRGDGR